MAFNFTILEGQESITIEEKIRQAISAAADCWENKDGLREYHGAKADEIIDVLGRAVLGELKKARKEGRREIRNYLADSVLAHPDYNPKEHGRMFAEQIAVILLARHDLKVEELRRAREGLHEAILKARPGLKNMMNLGAPEETACRLIVQQAAEIAHWKANLVADLERVRGNLQADRHFLNTLLLQLFPEEFNPAMLAVAEETTVARVARKLHETKQALDSTITQAPSVEVLATFRSNMQMKGQYRAIIAALSAANPTVINANDERWSPALEAIYALRADPGISGAVARTQVEGLAAWFAEKMPGRDTKGDPVGSAIELMDLIAYAMPQIVKLFVDNVYSPAMSVLRQAGIDVSPDLKHVAVKPDAQTGPQRWKKVGENG